MMNHFTAQRPDAFLGRSWLHLEGGGRGRGADADTDGGAAGAIASIGEPRRWHN